MTTSPTNFDKLVSLPSDLVKSLVSICEDAAKFGYEKIGAHHVHDPGLGSCVDYGGEIGVVASIATTGKGLKLYGCQFVDEFRMLGLHDFCLVLLDEGAIA
ncbi:hypothetical protein [Pseudanabaena sp. PCC 6802]|uniref:hypothetical protein n=1 Tax=Pseudanabaena sp. PCC 6802 TaxID=118173 RepID=UPI0003466A38|nr:hypothetical protein [Pseudanabaena sp. PCC 6802]